MSPHLPCLICLWGLILPLHGQEPTRRKKPVLIRADRTDEMAVDAPFLPDPLQAREHVEVGNFYYKRDNFEAAENRYREAIRHDRKWAEAYKKLIQSLEKRKAYFEAIDVCLQFTATNPASQEVESFQKRARKLKEAADR
jgi:tetratricopeptide (TPR) repeat protein